MFHQFRLLTSVPRLPMRVEKACNAANSADSADDAQDRIPGHRFASL